MKCPRCWTERALVRTVSGLRKTLLRCLLLVPLRCEHCYHEFLALRFLLGRRQPASAAPRGAPSRRAPGLSYAGRQTALPRLRVPVRRADAESEAA